MICMLTRDLMSASTVRAAAENLNQPFQLVQSVDELRTRLEQSTPIQAVVVDLQTPGLELSEVATLLQTAKIRPNTIAFAQHVHPQLLQAARDVFDTVLTRGKFLATAQDCLAAAGQTEK